MPIYTSGVEDFLCIIFMYSLFFYVLGLLVMYTVNAPADFPIVLYTISVFSMVVLNSIFCKKAIHFCTFFNKSISNGCVTLLEVTENLWRLSRTANRFEILSQNFEVTSAESLNHV